MLGVNIMKYGEFKDYSVRLSVVRNLCYCWLHGTGNRYAKRRLFWFVDVLLR
ncbi:UNVERIFIED_ORG: hypothetical protein C7430_108185 [Pantoea agglomerans]|uniref:Uncharacterized protein n=1 Tax=Enterobacter agglomerans TaxID=549 RepID=A0ABD6XSK7_ENTAG